MIFEPIGKLGEERSHQSRTRDLQLMGLRRLRVDDMLGRVLGKSAERLEDVVDTHQY